MQLPCQGGVHYQFHFTDGAIKAEGSKDLKSPSSSVWAPTPLEVFGPEGQCFFRHSTTAVLRSLVTGISSVWKALKMLQSHLKVHDKKLNVIQSIV
jgi:hypothetical protein